MKEFILKLRKLYRSVWLFPVLLIIPVIALTFLRIHGSSISAYPMIYDQGAEDAGIVWGVPRGVRSDEWLVTTQMVIAQSEVNFSQNNENIANGQNMSLIADVPYKDWSAVFRPQNFSFFLMPLEYAFAFRWWILLYSLIVAAYFFVLSIFPSKRLLGALFGFMTGLSPMIIWWYASGIVLTLSFVFLVIALSIQLIKSHVKRKKLLFALLLAYILVCFALLLYPPFQIPVVIVTLAFLIGWIIEERPTRTGLKNVFNDNWRYMLLVLVLVVFLVSLFLLTRQEVIRSITGTVYPGDREIVSGGGDPLHSISSFLSPSLQYDEKAAVGYFGNQSEASNFLFIAPFLFLPSFYLIVSQSLRQKGALRKYWALLFMNLLLVLFLARMYVTTPWLDGFYELLLLDKVPGKRLLIGVGLAGLLQLILLIRALKNSRINKRELVVVALITGLLSFCIMVFVGIQHTEIYPQFISSIPKIFLFAGWVALAITLITYRKFLTGLTMLVVFSFASVYKVHPLYQGLAPYTSSPIIESIQSYPKDSSWAVADDRLLINFPIMAGRDSINSVHYYPQMELWSEIDTTGDYENVYNRYAHVVFISEDSQADPFLLKHADTVYVKLDSCNEFLQGKVDYILAPNPIKDECVTQDKTIDLKQKDLYIYKIIKR